MEYTYLLEERANKDITLDNENGMVIIYLLCYHINNDHKYPFIQFMMDKIPFCNNIIKERLILPYIIINEKSSDMDIELDIIKNQKCFMVRIKIQETALLLR